MASLAPIASASTADTDLKRPPSATRAGPRSASTERFTRFVGRALSPGRAPAPRGLVETMNAEPRGRDPLISTGRGGAGNIVRELSLGPDDTGSPARGRELRDRSVDRATHAGRGGAGNIRSPSRDPVSAALCEAQEDALQDALIAERRGREENQTFTTGRGGAGNIGASRSRSRSAVRDVASPAPAASPLARVGSSSRTRAGRDESRSRGFAGRGGYGNITEEAGEEELARRVQEDLFEAAVRKRYEEGEPAALKTTGRGGAGSVAHDLTPMDMEKLALEESEARDKFLKGEVKQPIRGGRGGAGNIVQRDEPRGREGSGHQHSPSTGSVFGSMLRSLSRAARGEKESAK